MNTKDPQPLARSSEEEEGHLPGAASSSQVAAKPRLLQLSPRQIGLCIGLPIGLFLFWTGPIWRHPWDISAIDSAIWWSYAPLPILVLACLAWSRRLTLRAFLLDTMTLTLLKYSVTFSIALILWGTAEPPPKRSVLRSLRSPAAAAEPAPAPTPIAPEGTGALRGVVTDAAGRPVAGALVFVDKGLERYVFAPPHEPLLLDNGTAGVTPRLSAAQTYQTISARSTDGHLHTLVAASAEGPLFNVPLLSSGVRSSVIVREPHGVSRIRCAVHQGEIEARSYLAVLAHPFFTITSEGGDFAWSGVPAGELRVAAFHPELGEAEAPAQLSAGAAAEVRVALSGSSPSLRR